MADTENVRGRLVVYGRDHCAQAHMLYRVLTDYGVPFEWRDIYAGDPTWRSELRSLARGNLSVPTVVFPDGSVLVEPWPDRVLSRLGIEPV